MIFGSPSLDDISDGNMRCCEELIQRSLVGQSPSCSNVPHDEVIGEDTKMSHHGCSKLNDSISVV